MTFATLLIFIGTMLLLSAFNLVEITFGKFIMMFFAVLFAYSGIRDMVKKGFPSGLTSMGIAALLTLNVFRIFTTGFWQALTIVVAVALIQSGIAIIKSACRKHQLMKRISRSDQD
ncbi:LiaF transmembrane domain-containing protein [Pseudothermotoga thermarum]|uniref:LiaF transmembrane domain-containing protein n=1 Tax=Pseudothermotoga thermarum DSM 5069 TaxID=688269 RepID=F7YYU2_9THEM|nr:hypothetical protein [Pseudothermotoga thermarum]AEH51130.1 hypothetical protein Theth_1050 [Pseudothermotoga thermarum DSM 5069]